MFSEFTFRGEGGGSAQKDQRFTFFIDIELWTRSLMDVGKKVLVLQTKG